LAGVFLATGAFAQPYPAKPVKIIVPFTAGSATDSVARIVGEKLAAAWGQAVAIENLPGAGGATGASAVAKAAPDGYTLLVHSAAFAASPALQAQLPYDPRKDFLEIGRISAQPFVLVVGPAAGAKTVSELIAMVKAKPGQLNFGTPGVGSSAHLTTEKFKLATGLDLGHVPNVGGPEVNADTAAGRVLFWIAPMPAALKDVREGKLVALAVTSATRSRALPEVPTMMEAGVSGFEATTWSGMWAPARVPAAVAEKLATDLARALASPDVREQLAKVGADPASMIRADFARFVRSEMDEAARLTKAAGIKPK
jgi:tripartite-type tricarboxylate transporter receptor subunit TctC